MLQKTLSLIQLILALSVVIVANSLAQDPDVSGVAKLGHRLPRQQEALRELVSTPMSLKIRTNKTRRLLP